MTITLLGEPKSTSHIYHYHCKFGRPSGYMTADGKAIKESYQLQAKSQWRREPIATSLKIAVTLFFGTKRKVDWDNYHKLTMDALTGIVWEDDSLIDTALVEKDYDKEHPRIEITILPV